MAIEGGMNVLVHGTQAKKKIIGKSNFWQMDIAAGGNAVRL